GWIRHSGHFFFQAENGIRDKLVTGVQTCALPISIRYNIRYGRWDANDAEVEEAASLAQIDGFIRMAPDGYETEVGERGLKLSGRSEERRVGKECSVRWSANN